MKKLLSILVLTMLISFGCHQNINSDNELKLLIESEHSFSKASAEQGIRDAFLSYLADDAIIFRPNPIAAKPYYLTREKTPGLLTWEPEYADISLAGDLGYTTGPYEFRKNKNAKEADGHGHYVSIWKKQQDGSWRVVIDCGIVHPKADTSFILNESLTKTTRPSPKILTKDELMSEQQKLLETDIAYLKSISDLELAKAFLDYGDDQARYYRMNAFPIISRENIMSSMNSQPGDISGTPIVAEIAVSGDLGYTYGLSELKTDAETQANSYLRIWKKKPDGKWKVVLDLENPIPSKE
ncbi:MAG: nuclear transport factor 2 family protein [bacterium]|nr:nuclear transport factor 2 family protein [bacterium]